MKMTKTFVAELEELGACASALAGLIHEESRFSDLLDGDLDGAYFFKESFDEEMLGWSSFFEDILGYSVKPKELGKATTDKEIEALLSKVVRSVGRANRLELDREELRGLHDGRNPFQTYGFEELERSLDTFLTAYREAA